MNKHIFLVLLVYCFLSPAAWAAEPGPIPVVVSIAPQKYMLERIAGSEIAVTVLVKPGADPHSYEPTPAQMRACAEARLYFSIGVPFEDIWLPRIGGAAKNLTIVSTIKGIQRLTFDDDALLLADLELSHDAHAEKEKQTGQTSKPKHSEKYAEDAPTHKEHDASGVDPHVWLSPMLVRQMLPGMVQALSKVRPEKTAEFRAAAESFSEDLEQLDVELAGRFDAFPKNRRVFLTFHPSWRYFAHNYGLTEVSIETNGKEPGPKDMKTVIDLARKFGITTVFVEPQFPKAAAKAVAGNLMATIEEVDPLAENLPDNWRRLSDALVKSFQH